MLEEAFQVQYAHFYRDSLILINRWTSEIKKKQSDWIIIESVLYIDWLLSC